MPEIIDVPGSPSPSNTFTRLSMMDFVRRRVGVVEGINLDYSGEFLVALQEFCKAKPWYWRIGTFSFSTEANTPTYDLGDIIPIDGASVERLLKVKILDPGSGKLLKLRPIFGMDTMDEAMVCTDVGQPESYFVAPATDKVLWLTKTPDDAYTIYVRMRMAPVMLPEKQPLQIPLVPGHCHYILALLYERNVLRCAAKKDKTLVAQYEEASRLYQEALDLEAANAVNFAEEDVSDHPGAGWGYGDDAIQSDHGTPYFVRHTRDS